MMQTEVWSELETSIISLHISYLICEYEKFCVYWQKSMLAEAVDRPLIATDREAWQQYRLAISTYMYFLNRI